MLLLGPVVVRSGMWHDNDGIRMIVAIVLHSSTAVNC